MARKTTAASRLDHVEALCDGMAKAIENLIPRMDGDAPAAAKKAVEAWKEYRRAAGE